MAIGEEYVKACERRTDISGHLPWLHDQVLSRPRCKVIELGTRTGQSTVAFLDAVSGANGGHVWSIDLDHPDVPDEWHESGDWSFLRADALGGEALCWAPRRVNVLFIDLDPHSYEQTLQALGLWLPRVLPGGLVLLHDTEFPEINCMPTPVHESEVGRAMTHFCARRGLEWRNMPGCFGLGVIPLP